MTTTHTPGLDHEPDDTVTRTRFRGTCSCGWKGKWEYADPAGESMEARCYAEEEATQHAAAANSTVDRYAVTVRVAQKLPTGYTRTTDSPTFYLDPNVQGIVSEDHAKRIVEHWMTDLLADTHEPSTTGIYVTAVAL